MVILSAESVGGKRDEVMLLALAFELMHTATLVHDDIIDQDEMRRDKPAVHTKWSVNDAILTGDALIALAVELASEYGEEILKTVARSALELCDGERMDITSSLEITTEESYFKRIREKSASLFRASTYCGALAGGGSSSEINALSAFGQNFGIAYQLKDDILDLTHKGTEILKDQKSGNITLPIIHFYTNNSLGQRKELESKLQTLMQNRNTNDTELSKSILETIRRTGSLDYCEKKIGEHLNRAVSSISGLRNSQFKAYLVEMTEILRSQS
jgi:geranylgeranyl pyrophosphate synthase